MDLQQIGETLRQAREEQGLSIEQVMELTKVSRFNIEAIENGREDLLPHPVYAKSFIKNYARVLGLDADDMLAGLRLAQREEYHAETYGKPLYAAPPQATPVTGWRTLRAAGLVVVILAATGVAAYRTLPSLKVLGSLSPAKSPVAVDQEAETKAVAPAQGEPPAPTPQGPASAVGSAAPAAQSAPQPPAPTATQTPGKPVAQTPAAPAPGAQPNGQPAGKGQQDAAAGQPGNGQANAAAPAAQQEQETPQTPSGQQHLTIRAVEACWMQARYADGRTREFYLRPGDSIDLDFESTLALRLGNAGGVRLTLNGQEHPFEARTGQVMTVRLP